MDSCLATNAKYKCYPDGSIVATYSSMPVFNMLPQRKPRDVLPFDNDIPFYVGASPSPLFLSVHLPDPYYKVDERTGEVVFTGGADIPIDLATTSGACKYKTKEKRRSDSLKRSQDKVFDLVMCNKWKYFVTLTVGNVEFDPTDPKSAVKPFQNWFKNQVKRNGLQYVVVPEYQPKSKRIHFHGFFNESLEMVDSGRRQYKSPHDVHYKFYDLKYFEKNGLNPDDYPIVYNIPSWKFGFSTAYEPYGTTQNAIQYMLKYMTKDSQKIFGRFYWSSRNLTREPLTAYYNFDYGSVIAKEYSIPRVQQKFKYYTFFPEQDTFHYDNTKGLVNMLEQTQKEAASFNSSAILAELAEYEKIQAQLNSNSYPDFEEITNYDDFSDFQEV